MYMYMCGYYMYVPVFARQYEASGARERQRQRQRLWLRDGGCVVVGCGSAFGQELSPLCC